MRKVQQHTFLKVYAYDARSFMYTMHIPQHVIACCLVHVATYIHLDFLFGSCIYYSFFSFLCYSITLFYLKYYAKYFMKYAREQAAGQFAARCTSKRCFAPRRSLFHIASFQKVSRTRARALCVIYSYLSSAFVCRAPSTSLIQPFSAPFLLYLLQESRTPKSCLWTSSRPRYYPLQKW